MKKLIFDLDGTLWGTGKCYIYAYNKAFDQLKIPSNKKKNDDFVLSYLGVKLDVLVQTMIPEAPDKRELGMLLLQNAVEYQLNHPETFSKNIYQLFLNLSKKYEIYIISNCPRAFLDAFYSVSGVKDLVCGDNTIEDSDKSIALRKITNDYVEKAIFVGDSDSDYQSIENHKVVKFVYAEYGYNDCEKFDLSLSLLDQIPQVLESYEKREECLKNDSYHVIYSNESSVTMIDKKDCWYFGFMEINQIADMDLLLEKIKVYGKEKPVYGPIDGSSWFNYRIALNEFDFELYPDCLSDEMILNKFYEYGFRGTETYTSTLSKLNLDIWKRNKKVKLAAGYECKIVKGDDCNKYLEAIFPLANECFSDHIFYDSIELETFLNLYEKNLKLCSPILILIFYNEKVVGFNFCYPDLENRFFVEKTFAIDKNHRNPHVLKKIIEVTNEEIEKLGFDKVLFHFQNSKLKTMQSYFKGLIIRQKEYGVLKYEYKK